MNAMEVGTGRTIIAPLAFWLAGLEATHTFDLNRYLRDELVSEALQDIRMRRDELRRLYRGHGVAIVDSRLDELCSGSMTGNWAMRLAGIQYTAPGDATNTKLPADSLDIHFSINVLEHVPSVAIGGIFREAMRVLRPGGVLLHQIDPSDHFSHSDHSITAINCLKFSRWQWRILAGNRYMYQNRMRSADYLRLAHEAGFIVEKVNELVDERSLAVLKNGFKVHRDFSGFGPEELAKVQLLLAARKPND